VEQSVGRAAAVKEVVAEEMATEEGMAGLEVMEADCKVGEKDVLCAQF